MNTQIDVKELIELAEEFSLPCIEREYEITVCGESTFLIFKREENNTCQLKTIV